MVSRVETADMRARHVSSALWDLARAAGMSPELVSGLAEAGKLDSAAAAAETRAKRDGKPPVPQVPATTLARQTLRNKVIRLRERQQRWVGGQVFADSCLSLSCADVV